MNGGWNRPDVRTSYFPILLRGIRMGPPSSCGPRHRGWGVDQAISAANAARCIISAAHALVSLISLSNHTRRGISLGDEGGEVVSAANPAAWIISSSSRPTGDSPGSQLVVSPVSFLLRLALDELSS